MTNSYKLPSLEERWAEMDRIRAAGPYQCAQCGAAAAVELPEQSCAACKAEAQREQVERDCIRRIEVAINNAIPAEYRGARLGSDALASRFPRRLLPQLEAAAQRLGSGEIRTVTLIGQSGTGKSTGAAAIEAHGIAQGWAGDSVAAPKWMTALEIAHSSRIAKFGEESDAEYWADQARLLVIDDLGLEGAQGRDALISVIHKRHSNQQRTIVTTGHSEATLLDLYGAGIVRRLFERAAVLNLDGRRK